MSYSCTLTKNIVFLLLETNEGRKAFCILTLHLFMFALNLFLHIFRNELARSLTNGNHFCSIGTKYRSTIVVVLRSYHNISIAYICNSYTIGSRGISE